MHMKNLLKAILAFILAFTVTSARGEKKIHIVFIGNSITYGATLSSPSTEAPPIIEGQLIQERTGVETKVSNCGISGLTTVNWLPGTSAYNNAVSAATTYSSEDGPLYFSIMLGTNDSAEKGTTGAPVSTDDFKANMKAIIDGLHAKFPTARFVINYPTWYSPNTHNGATYLQAGLNRLKSYRPVMDAMIAEYASSNAGLVNYGDTTAFTYFEKHPALFTAESGVDGTFYLHPNASGAKYLAGLWADALMKVLSDDGIKEVSEDERYVMGEDLITDTFQLSTNTMESYQFSPSNLILPETDGYGTGQFIYHCAWTHPLPSGQYPYIQVKLYKPETDIFFTYISSEWTGAYDSPRDFKIMATNTPDNENSWVEVTTLTDMATAVAHPIKYTSPHIALGGSYSYLRFICTRNVTGRLTANGGPLFNMGRFMVMRADKADNPKAKLQLTLDNIYNKGLNYAGGTEPGYYNGEKVDNFIIAYEDASAGISGDLGDDDATKLYNALTTAYSDMMATYIPVKPGYYHFISALPRFESTQGVKKAMCILSNGHLGWDTYNEKDPRFLFQVEALSDSTYSIRSVYNNKYISYYGGAGVNIPMTDEQVTPQLIDQIGTYPQFHIANTSFYVPYHAAGHNGGSGVNGDIVAWQDNADSPSAWYLMTESDEALIDSLTKAAAKEYLADQVSTAINSTGAIRDLANDYTALLTDGSQITANSVEADQFAPANLLRPVSDGYGTGQYIFHTSWSNPLPASTYPYLQVYLPKAMRTIKYHMISSEWGSTYDTPTEIEILATNDTNDATSWKSVYEQKNIITKMTHPVIYTSPTIDLGADYQALRFVVKSTINNRGKSATTSFYLSLGRFNIYSPDAISETSEYYTVDGMKEACDAYDQAKSALRTAYAAGTATEADVKALYAAADKISGLYVDRDSLYNVLQTTITKANEAYNSAVPTSAPIISDGSQITSNSVESDQFTPANLIRPESDGYSTGQYIYHSSWSDPLSAGTYPYLQVHLNSAIDQFHFSMISSEWERTFDTPRDINIYATNTPDDEGSWTKITEMKDIVTAIAHPIRYTSPTISLGASYTDVRFEVPLTVNQRRASESDAYYLSLGRFQMYTGVDPNTVQYNYNPEVKEAADALKALVDADKAITRLSVKASDITVLEEAISKLSASFADTTEFTSLYRNTKDWIAQILVGEEFGDADSQDNVDAFVNTINSIRQNTNTYQPKKAELAAAVEELKKAKKDFVDNHIKHIEANKWYYIISNSTLEYCNGMSMVSYSSDGNSEIHYGTTDQNGESLYYSPQAMWRFVPIEGTDYYGIQNMASAHFYGPTSGQGRDHTCRMQASISPFRIDYIGKSQIHFVSINSNNPDEIPIHAQNEQHVIVPWQAGIDAASSWTVMEVDDSELLNNTVKENSINLMTLPYDIPGGSNSLMSLNSNIKTYSIKNVVADYETGSTKVELTINDDIKAGVPFVLIEGDYTQYNAETAANVTFNTNIPATVDTIVGTANGLVATSEGADISTKGMIYANGTLQMVADSPVHIGGLSAWIDASKVTPAEGDADLTISLLGIVNGIQPAAVTGSSDKMNVYTLDGVLVNKGVKASEARKDLKPGTIYIIGGKKVLIK